MVLLSSGHSRRVLVQGLTFALAAGAAGAAVYAVIGALGAVTSYGSKPLSLIALAVGGLWCLAWYIWPSPRLLPSPSKQLNRQYVEVPVIGSAAFGGVLGIGLLTLVTTPLVWVGALTVLASGSVVLGAVYGASFALGRASQLLWDRVRAQRPASEIGLWVARRRQTRHRVGALLAVSLVVAAALGRAFGLN